MNAAGLIAGDKAADLGFIAAQGLAEAVKIAPLSVSWGAVYWMETVKEGPNMASCCLAWAEDDGTASFPVGRGGGGDD